MTIVDKTIARVAEDLALVHYHLNLKVLHVVDRTRWIQNSSTASTEKVDEGFNFIFKRLGSGLNCPETTEMRFSDYAIQMNQASGENVVL